MNEVLDESTLTLKSGRVLLYKVYKEGIEFVDVFLSIAAKAELTEEGIENFRANSGFESESFVVSEYIGSESQSENWSPDLYTPSITDDEIWEVLCMFDAGKFDNS